MNAVGTQNPPKRTQRERKKREKEHKVNAPTKSIRVDNKKVVAVCTQIFQKRTQRGRKRGIWERSLLAVMEYQGF